MIKNIIENNKDVRPNSEVMERLHRDFSDCFNREGKFDMAKFQALISDKVDLVKENQGFDFLGKSYARMLTGMDSTTVIVPDEVHNREPENINSENIYISGDNLDALKHLAKSYAGRVKCIYIDPPYNTGSDGFVYNDKFKFTKEELAEKLNIEEEIAERILGFNDGSTCSDAAWLTFMLPRLQKAKEMLKDDGVIFISIDENEQANLKLLCNEIFGEINFAGEIVWKNSSKNDEDYISVQHEYILCYVRDKEKNIGNWKERKQGTDEIFAAFDGFRKQYGNDWKAIHEAALKWYAQFSESNPIFDSKHYNWMDEKGIYFPSDISGPNYGQYRYDVIHPVTGKVCKEPASGWRFSETTMAEKIAQGLIHFGDDETTVPNNKTYLADTLEQSLPSIIYKDGRVATKKLTALMGLNCFSNPKDYEVIARLLNAVGVEDGDIVMDFFSGSGTTAESVMRMNVGGKSVKFILVQIKESLDESLKRATGNGKSIVKNAIRICDNLHVPHTVDEIGQERIRRVGKNVKAENPLFAGDFGFKHYTLQELPEETIDKLEEFKPLEFVGAPEMLKLMGGKEAVLTTWLCDDHYGLGAELQHIKLGGYTAYYIDKHLYLIDEGFNEQAMAGLMEKYERDVMDFHPATIVVFGYSFSLAEMLMLKKNIPALKDNESGTNITVDVRY